MSPPRTAFIVGAGASAEFGFPVGKELQAKISGLLKPAKKYDWGVHDVIAEEIQTLQVGGMPHSALLEHLEWMSSTLRLSSSIDSFLDRHSEPGDVTSTIGKLAITSIIAECEAKSPLSRKASELDWIGLTETWLGKLWKLESEGGIKNKLENPMPNSVFVTFNYDRCIEHFINLAVSQSYKISYEEAGSFTMNVPCEHVYGSLGLLITKNSSRFGGYRYPNDIKVYYRSIKTFSEQVDSLTCDKISKLINECRRVVFLGFSFGKINQRFLSRMQHSEASLKTVLGTSCGLSQADREIAVAWADSCFRRGNSGSVLQDMTCSKFFDDNYLVFSR